MNSQKSLKYPLALRILHWLMAVIIICLIAAGLIMADMPREDPNRALLFSLHKSFGITIALLAVLRLFIRLRKGAPELPEVIPVRERLPAKAGHWALYGFFFAMPLTGYLMSTYYGLPVKWFGLALPRLAGVDKETGTFFSNAHSYLGFTLIGLISLHVAALPWHFFKEKVNLLKRMW